MFRVLMMDTAEREILRPDIRTCLHKNVKYFQNYDVTNIAARPSAQRATALDQICAVR